MKLTDHFTLEEFVESDTAERLGIENKPDTMQMARLLNTAQSMEQVRALLGSPIIITSGFRCLKLNRAIKSSDTSHHILGDAVDFKCPGFGSPRKICEYLAKLSTFKFDDMILEAVSKSAPDGVWVHLSFNPKMRRQIRTMSNGNYAPGLVRV